MEGISRHNHVILAKSEKAEETETHNMASGQEDPVVEQQAKQSISTPLRAFLVHSLALVIIKIFDANGFLYSLTFTWLVKQFVLAPSTALKKLPSAKRGRPEDEGVEQHSASRKNSGNFQYCTEDCKQRNLEGKDVLCQKETTEAEGTGKNYDKDVGNFRHSHSCGSKANRSPLISMRSTDQFQASPISEFPKKLLKFGGLKTVDADSRNIAQDLIYKGCQPVPNGREVKSFRSSLSTETLNIPVVLNNLGKGSKKKKRKRKKCNLVINDVYENNSKFPKEHDSNDRQIGVQNNVKFGIEVSDASFSMTGSTSSSVILVCTSYAKKQLLDGVPRAQYIEHHGRKEPESLNTCVALSDCCFTDQLQVKMPNVEINEGHGSEEPKTPSMVTDQYSCSWIGAYNEQDQVDNGSDKSESLFSVTDYTSVQQLHVLNAVSCVKGDPLIKRQLHGEVVVNDEDKEDGFAQPEEPYIMTNTCTATIQQHVDAVPHVEEIKGDHVEPEEQFNVTGKATAQQQEDVLCAAEDKVGNTEQEHPLTCTCTYNVVGCPTNQQLYVTVLDVHVALQNQEQVDGCHSQEKGKGSSSNNGKSATSCKGCVTSAKNQVQLRNGGGMISAEGSGDDGDDDDEKKRRQIPKKINNDGGHIMDEEDDEEEEKLDREATGQEEEIDTSVENPEIESEPEGATSGSINNDELLEFGTTEVTSLYGGAEQSYTVGRSSTQRSSGTDFNQLSLSFREQLISDPSFVYLSQENQALEDAFKCKRKKRSDSAWSQCPEQECCRTYKRLNHCRDCILKVLGGCDTCCDFRDILLCHAFRCSEGDCAVPRCQDIREYIRENGVLSPETTWTLQLDRLFFCPAPPTAPITVSQNHNITDEEVEELIARARTCQYSESMDPFLSGPAEPQVGATWNSYHVDRPPETYNTVQVMECFSKQSTSTDTSTTQIPPVIVARGSAIEPLASETSANKGQSKIKSASQSGDQHFQHSGSAIIKEGRVNVDKSIEHVVLLGGAYNIPRPSAPDSPALEECPVENNRSVYQKSRKRPTRHGRHKRPTNVQFLRSLDTNRLSVNADGQYDEGFEWHRVHYLGGGASGRCFLCTDGRTNFMFAIKKVPKEKFEQSELDVWSSISGLNVSILETYGAVQANEVVIIFMEYMEGGSIELLLDELEGCLLDENTALYFLYPVVQGVVFLHDRNILHRDVKGGNILVNDTGTQVKIADYGEAVQLKNVEFVQNNAPRGTTAFMAPEVCRSESHSFSADIWSLACLLYQMLTGESPWMQYKHGSILFQVGIATRPPDLPECSAVVQDLFQCMFALKPENRHTARELLNHPAFQSGTHAGPPNIPRRTEPLDEDDEDDVDDYLSGVFSSHSSMMTDLSMEPVSANFLENLENLKVFENNGESIDSSTYPTATEADVVEGHVQHLNPVEEKPAINSCASPEEESAISDNEYFSFQHLVQEGRSPADEKPSSSNQAPDEAFLSMEEEQHNQSTNEAHIYTESLISVDDNSITEQLIHLQSPPSLVAEDGGEDDELAELQSDFLRSISEEGHDVSELLQSLGPSYRHSSVSVEEDDPFDDSGIHTSLLMAQSPRSAYSSIQSPSGTYSMTDLTKVELFDGEMRLLLTMREKSCYTYRNLAESLRHKIALLGGLKDFTFTSLSGCPVEVNSEIGCINQELKVIPATFDGWQGWRMNRNGILEQHFTYH